MAMDSVAVCALIKELSECAVGGRIEKIHQPEKDELTLSIRTFTDSFKITVSASPSNARVHIGSIPKENPKTAPMFCMLLRKHLQSGKILGFSQPDFERIIKMTVQTRNELGDLVERYLICELTGRNSNIILTDENDRIIDSARHVDFTQSSVRNIMPGLTYKPLPPQEKAPILDPDADFDISYSDGGALISREIMNAVSGIGSITARELVHSVTGRIDTKCIDADDGIKSKIKAALISYRNTVLDGTFTPSLITESGTGRLIDFSATEIMQYENAANIRFSDSMSEIIMSFYSERDSKERMKQRSFDLIRLLNSNLERLARKLVIQQNTLRDAENKEEYKKLGDLITSSIYMLKPGMKTATLPDYFSEGTPEVTVKLSEELTPSENAQRYYKKYNKAKTAEIEVKKQLKATMEEIEYLESILAHAENLSELQDITAIRQELTLSGYIKPQRGAKNAKKADSSQKPHHFVSSDGFDIYVGKNNIQNDYLTLKLANSSDIWFHTKKIHGSHTVIKLGIDKDVPKKTMMEAAQLAAYYSKARTSSQVPVDYTEIKNVKKPNGAKPGMVIYDSYNTVYTTPKSPEELGLV